MRALRIAGWGVLIALGGQLAHVMSAQQVATSTAAPRSPVPRARHNGYIVRIQPLD